MERRDLRLLIALAALSSALLLAVAAGAVGGVLLYVAPVALLVLPLLAGRYVGEDAIQRLVARRAAPAMRRPAATRSGVGRARRAAPGGGLLLAVSLGKRGPPAPVTAH